jgi:hypothetical protein
MHSSILRRIWLNFMAQYLVFSAHIQFSFFFSDFQLFRPEYHWRDLSSRNAHLVHQKWYHISFTSFEWYVLGLWYFTRVMNEPPMSPNRFDLVTSTLMFDLHIENFNHAYIFQEYFYDFDTSHECFLWQSLFWASIGLTMWPWTLCLTYLPVHQNWWRISFTF